MKWGLVLAVVGVLLFGGTADALPRHATNHVSEGAMYLGLQGPYLPYRNVVTANVSRCIKERVGYRCPSLLQWKLTDPGTPWVGHCRVGVITWRAGFRLDAKQLRRRCEFPTDPTEPALRSGAPEGHQAPPVVHLGR